MSKHPELHKDLLTNGVSYGCAFGRLELGWSLERAVSEPPRKRGPRKLKPYNASHARQVRTLKRLLTPRNPIKRYYIPKTRHAEDTSPPDIRDLRRQYCDNFIKTGELDRGMLEKLQAFALSKRGTTDGKRNRRKPKVSSLAAVHAAQAPTDRERDAAGGSARGSKENLARAWSHVSEQRTPDERGFASASHGSGRASDYAGGETEWPTGV